MVGILDVMSATPETPSDKTETVRIRADLVKLAKMLAAKADKSVPDFLTELFGPVLQERYRQMVQEMAKELKPRHRNA